VDTASDRAEQGPGTASAPADGTDMVMLAIPAKGQYLSVLRTATAGLAARLQFTLDEIEDLRIAVDEACALLLMGLESPDATLTCRFVLVDEEITVTVQAPAQRPSLRLRETFAWQVLTALAGRVEAEVVEGEAVIRLTKRRAPRRDRP
jgi:serine/threonine-protein kinase RsbW